MTCMSPLVDIEINLRAVVTNFCDPSTYPDNSLLETLYGVRCFSTIGLHPKGASKYTDADIQKFCMLLERPEVVGFGEVGLDHSVPYAEWLGQAILLKRVLSFLKERHVLVLHCRGADGDIHGKEVHMCLLSIMLGVVSPEQRIHLHCFQGDMEVLRSFLNSFPNTYVGYTHNVDDLTEDAAVALRLVPSDRLLIETDAPYFGGPTIGNTSSPMVVGWAAKHVGRFRGESTKSVLRATVANTRALYRLNW